ncbi:hypothetical protein BOX15_Mlig016561g2 [Macrostomum lignano]|uniref:DNA polymerase epsilon catalytic subunit n=1 Tax=Macrostomum lignano TaxID=282301 RepID=A0A267ERT2_9PLAT|nr:hypothetical protein BOX15_Mlig016561g2 [Macrostomum lignano]
MKRQKFEKSDNSKSDGQTTDEGAERRIRRVRANETIDEIYGFVGLKEPGEHTGWLVNMHPSDVIDEEKRLVSAVDYYFLRDDGSRFKVSMPYRPYFYAAVRSGCEHEVLSYLSKKYSGKFASLDLLEKEDLELANHLSGLKKTYIKLAFFSVDDLMRVKRELLPKVKSNRDKESAKTAYTSMLASHFSGEQQQHQMEKHHDQSKSETGYTHMIVDQTDNILDLREHDVPYHVRVSIDLKIFVGSWYRICCRGSSVPEITPREDLVDRPDPVVLAYDIETTKLPLKFPDAASDQIMMISYMIDGDGFLICNREIIAEDVEDFEFTPRPEFEGLFTVFNEPDEKSTIERFFNHVVERQPTIFVTYNGDFFDWPFVEARASVHGINMQDRIGFARDNQNEYKSRPAIHMDCLKWVKRDSYLPVGSQGLKAVAKAKLRYNPVEIDPEDMCRMAAEDPRQLANYSVSDAVATYYLYMKYVHPFIFALCTIIPMEPDEVLRKGSGTLCEALLMVEAYHANIVYPNKQEAQLNKLTPDGHVLDQETYVGGHVEALESGVFRANLPCKFKMVPEAFQDLIHSVEDTMRHAVETEAGVPLSDCLNFADVCSDIKAKLADLRDNPIRVEKPIIYHLDVGAMYPNIILTNRLQPSAIVNSTVCAACDFNRPGERCQRTMIWSWRGEIMPANRSEYHRIQAQLEQERFPPAAAPSGSFANDKFKGRFQQLNKHQSDQQKQQQQSSGPGATRAFYQLSKEEKAAVEKKRLTDFCRRAYKKVHVTRLEQRTATICQRENSFYVDTVRAFRDRRYKFKDLCKVWKNNLDKAVAKGDAGEVKRCNGMLVLYDSLQLAHKCILNSFYGYVMRKGARWYSMEMAGIVCHTGANIITKAREIVEQIGRPLELDTDGIWCVLPASFPENFTVRTSNAKKPKLNISYPGAMLNAMVQQHFTNDQYHELVATNGSTIEYRVRSENSIFFEVDGPYLAMVLPASKEEGKKLKKRYAVFNFDGSLAELKGFEVKRNGELQLIKIFQSSVFEAFLKGDSLAECYAAVAKVADYWLDVLFSKAESMPDTELFELIAENRSMSKRLEDYGGQKSTSISTAKRLAEFLGEQMVKDAGLACRFVISKRPEGAPVTERAVPLAIFQAEPSVKRHFLRRWLKSPGLQDLDIRSILDWDYYIERLSSAVQKIITIPAALQHVANPVPRVPHPDWLRKKLLEKTDVFKQRRISDMFSKASAKPRLTPDVVDVEDAAGPTGSRKRVRINSTNEQDDAEDSVLMEDRDGEDAEAAEAGSQDAIGAANKPPVVNALSRTPGPAASSAVTDLDKPWFEALGEPPRLRRDSSKGFADWLRFHKRKWRHQRAQQRACNAGGGASKRARTAGDSADSTAGESLSTTNILAPLPLQSVGIGASSGVGGMSAFIRRNQRALLDRPWEIVQLAGETGEPGLFRMWIVVDQELRCVKVQVPRIFYVNHLTAKTDCPADTERQYRRVSRTLPRNRVAHHLYEYRMPESVYRKNQDSIRAQLMTNDVLGVFELSTSLWFRAVLRLGCLCVVDRDWARRLVASGRDTDTFPLDSLWLRSASQSPYLASSRGLKLSHFYHHTSGRLQIWAIFTPGNQPRCHVFIMAQSGGRLASDWPGLATGYAAEWRRREAAMREALGDQLIDGFMPPETFSFDVKSEQNIDGIVKAIDKCLSSNKTERRTPTIMTVDSSTPLSELTRRFHSLQDYPLVPVPPLHQLLFNSGHQPDSAEENYGLGLDWQRLGAARMIGHYLDSCVAYAKQLSVARYHQVPIGNLPINANESAILGIDVFLGRTLLKQNHLLWCSDSESPDLGGFESDDLRLDLDLTCEIEPFETVRPGFYPAYCAHIDVSSLAVCALLQCARIHEMEGGAQTYEILPVQGVEEMMSEAAGSSLSQYDETAACSTAFRTIRSLALAWIRDVTQHSHRCADNLLVHLQRWFRSPQSRFHDPALLRTLQRLMRKLQIHLLAELRTLGGGQVIRADFYNILLATGKQNPDDCLAYARHVCRTLCSKDAFQALDLQVSGVYSALLFLDAANFCGIRYEVTPEDEEDLDDEAEEAEDRRDRSASEIRPSQHPSLRHRRMECQWNLGEFLPISLQPAFDTVLTGLLLATETLLYEEGKTAGKGLEEALLTLLKGSLSHDLMAQVDAFRRRFKSAGGAASKLIAVPNPPGRRADADCANGGLEFAKSVCRVLSLADCLAEEADRVKAALLRLAGVGEFSSRGDWTNPCASLTLAEVACHRCDFVRNLDLCRDPLRRGRGAQGSWLCPRCDSPYERSMLELRLLNVAKLLAMNSSLQDLTCSKCNSVMDRSLAKLCPCAGKFRCTVNGPDMLVQLRTLLSVAEHFDLALLRTTANLLLSTL